MNAAKDVFLTVDRDGWTKGIQISIGTADSGYRIAGPKYNGSSASLVNHRLSERDIREIQTFLDLARAQVAS